MRTLELSPSQPGRLERCDQGRELRDGVPLLDEGVDPGPLRSPPVLERIGAGQDDDAYLRPALLDEPQDPVPVEPGHVQIEQDDRGLFGGDPGEAGLAIACLADDELEQLIVCERCGHPESEERLVIDDQNSDGHVDLRSPFPAARKGHRRRLGVRHPNPRT